MKRIITVLPRTILTLGLCAAMLAGLCACGAAGVKDADSAPAGETQTGVPVQVIASGAAAEQLPQVTVSASGTVRLTPDKATVHFGVTTQETTAELAQTRNSEAVKQVIAMLLSRGIEEKSIRTTGYSMYPQYNYYYDKEEEPQIVGYVVRTSMSVEDQDIKDLGALLGACVDAGINSVDNVVFLCSGYDAAYSEALTEAVKAARAKAEVLAAAAGKTLGEAVIVTEGWQDTSARYGRSANMDFDAAAESAKSIGPDFQPGETEIAANVTVTFRMW